MCGVYRRSTHAGCWHTGNNVDPGGCDAVLSALRSCPRFENLNVAGTRGRVLGRWATIDQRNRT